MIPEDYKFWCDFYAKELDEIAAGESALPLPAGTLNLPRSTTEDQQKIFTRTKLDKSGTIKNPDEPKSLDVI